MSGAKRLTGRVEPPSPPSPRLTPSPPLDNIPKRNYTYNKNDPIRANKGGDRINSCVLSGAAASDISFRTTQSGIATCNFRIAVRRRFKNQTTGQYDTDFFTVVAFRNNAEYCRDYLTKGKRVIASGSMQNREYDAQDGSHHLVTELIADNVEIVEPRDSATPYTPNRSQTAQTTPEQTPPAQTQTAGRQQSRALSYDDDDELPF